MATEVKNGVSLTISLAGAGILGEDDATMTVETNVIDNTHKSTATGSKAFSPGRSTTTFEFNQAVYEGGSGDAGTAADYINKQTAGTQVAIVYAVNGDSFTANGYIVSMKVAGGDDAKPTVAGKVQVDGALTIPA